MDPMGCDMPNWKSRVGRVRLIGMVEGISFLLLVGVAMPLKYFAGFPEAVRLTGGLHGFLFICYVLAIFAAWVRGHLSFGKSALALAASLVPVGPFLIDRKLAEEEVRGSAPR